MPGARRSLRKANACARPRPRPQVVSDFGFGRARRRAELFISGYERTYYLRRVRILGDDVRVFKCYPGPWQVGRGQGRRAAGAGVAAGAGWTSGVLEEQRARPLHKRASGRLAGCAPPDALSLVTRHSLQG